MILDPRGRKIRMPQTMTANAIIFVSDDGDTWQPLEPSSVPGWLKDPATMGYLIAGEILEGLECGKIYKAETIDAVH